LSESVREVKTQDTYDYAPKGGPPGKILKVFSGRGGKKAQKRG